jgi:hypothetical protein
MSPPLTYCVELGAELLTLRRHDGFTVATFSARGAAMELVESAAREDYEDSPPSPGGGEQRYRRRATS